VREISAQVGISYGTRHAILTEDLNMRRFTVNFAPCVLTIMQKEQCLSVATNLLQEADAYQKFTEGIITGDKTCVSGYNPETKRQSSHWRLPESPRPKEAHHACSKVKTMLRDFFLTWKRLFSMNTSSKVKQ
jgi:hypothetical protein